MSKTICPFIYYLIRLTAQAGELENKEILYLLISTPKKSKGVGHP